jgi:hypothetical protein
LTNTITIVITGMIIKWLFDKPSARRIINVSSIFIRTPASLKKENCVIKRYTWKEGRIMIISLLETRNKSYLKSERGSVWDSINTFVQKHDCCSAKSHDLRCLD